MILISFSTLAKYQYSEPMTLLGWARVESDRLSLRITDEGLLQALEPISMLDRTVLRSPGMGGGGAQLSGLIIESIASCLRFFSPRSKSLLRVHVLFFQ